MLVKRRAGWELAEGSAHSEHDYYSRRKLLKTVGTALVGAGVFGSPLTAAVLNSRKNQEFQRLEPTAEKLITSYNNFYEFTTDKKGVKKLAARMITNPWEVQITGLAENTGIIDIDDIFKKFSVEQRIYRLRCVETWSAVVPWDGFPLKALLDYAKPLSSAKFVAFTTYVDKAIAPGMAGNYFPWPYMEGLTIEEAANPLSFMATGIYGKTLPPQNGAPMRLVIPWKYGFKSIKSIRRIHFTDRMPATFWNTAQANEYGFYANVNPQVDHPRWSQKYDKPLGSFFGREKTLMFNGYGEQVAHLYKNMDLRRFF